jgi:hypothetical protein
MWNVQNKHSGQQRLCKELLDSGNQRLCQKMHSGQQRFCAIKLHSGQQKLCKKLHSGQQRLCPRLHSGQRFQLVNKSASLWATEIVQNCTLVNRDYAHICKFLGNSNCAKNCTWANKDCAQNCNLVDQDCVHKNVQVSGAIEIVLFLNVQLQQQYTTELSSAQVHRAREGVKRPRGLETKGCWREASWWVQDIWSFGECVHASSLVAVKCRKQTHLDVHQEL